MFLFDQMMLVADLDLQNQMGELLHQLFMAYCNAIATIYQVY